MDARALSWCLLAASVVTEVAGTLALRFTDGLTRPLASLAVAACYASAVWFMSIAVRHLEMGLVYAIWAGSGVALTALVGIVWFDESATALRIVGLSLIVLGVVTLNLGSS